MDKLYIKNDLERYGTGRIETGENKFSMSRSDALNNALPSAEIETVRVGDYQGTIGFLIRVGGYTWLIKESYGSCSYCDGWLASDDVARYTRSMMRNAYCFEQDEDAEEFLKQKIESDGYFSGWQRIASDLKQLFN